MESLSPRSGSVSFVSARNSSTSLSQKVSVQRHRNDVARVLTQCCGVTRTEWFRRCPGWRHPAARSALHHAPQESSRGLFESAPQSALLLKRRDASELPNAEIRDHLRLGVGRCRSAAWPKDIAVITSIAAPRTGCFCPLNGSLPWATQRATSEVSGR